MALFDPALAGSYDASKDGGTYYGNNGNIYRGLNDSKAQMEANAGSDLEVFYNESAGGWNLRPKPGGSGGGGGDKKPKPPAKPKPKTPPGGGNKPPAPGGGTPPPVAPPIDPGTGGGSPVSGAPITPPSTAGAGGGGGGALGGLMDAAGDGTLGYRQGMGIRQPPVSPGPLAGLRRVY